MLGLCSKRCRERVSIHIPQDLDEAIVDLGSADALLGMRLHSCILAARLGIPFTAVSYDRKVDEFLASFRDQSSVHCVSDFGPQCWRSLKAQIPDAESRPQRHAELLTVLEEQARQNFLSLPGSIGTQVGCRIRAQGLFCLLLLLTVGGLAFLGWRVRSWCRAVGNHMSCLLLRETL